MIEYLIGLMFIVLLYASYVDIKIREVDAWLTTSLFVIAVVFRLGMSYFYGFNFIVEGIFGLVFFIGGYLLYRLGQWGGGDAQLIGAMGILFGTTFSVYDFMIQYLIALIFGGAIWGVGYSIYRIIKSGKKIKVKYELYVWIICLIIGLFFHSLFSLFFIIIASSYSLYPRLRVVEKLMIKEVKFENLVEGDWILEEVKVDGKVISRKGIGLTKEDLKLLKKKKGTVKVKDGIPFVPSFLVALVLMIIWMLI